MLFGVGLMHRWMAEILLAGGIEEFIWGIEDVALF